LCKPILGRDTIRKWGNSLPIRLGGPGQALYKGVGGIYSRKDAETQRICSPLGLTSGGLSVLAASRAKYFFLLSQRPTAAGRTLSRKEIVVDLPQAG
jgi:hypothetical protein